MTDMDDLFDYLFDVLKARFSKRKNSDGDNKKRGCLRYVFLAMLIAMLVISIPMSIYIVDEKSEAVVTTLGKVTAIKKAGFHFKIPFVQRVTKVETNKVHKFTIGYNSDDPENSVIEESKMITGDFNIVNVDFFVEWRITDPVKYLYKIQNPEETLNLITQSASRAVIGSKSVDDVLTTGKSIIQTEIKNETAEKLKIYDLGISIVDIKIQDAEPADKSVITAFKAVETAKQEKETALNEAKKYKNSEIPLAKTKADKLTQSAEAKKERRVNEAKGEVAKFNEMFSEYRKNKEITKTRLYYETMEEILPNLKTYVNAEDTYKHMILNK